MTSDKREPGVEPSPWRNSGPYSTWEELLAQFEAWSFGLPVDDATARRLVLRESLMMAGVEVSAYEEGVLAALCQSFSNAEAQLFAGFILRACLAGHEAGRAA